MFAPARYLDPLRTVHGTADRHYDCPDLTTLDHHIRYLSERIATVDTRSPRTAEVCRADIDRLLDRRAWLTLPVAGDECGLRSAS